MNPGCRYRRQSHLCSPAVVGRGRGVLRRRSGRAFQRSRLSPLPPLAPQCGAVDDGESKRRDPDHGQQHPQPASKSRIGHVSLVSGSRPNYSADLFFANVREARFVAGSKGKHRPRLSRSRTEDEFREEGCGSAWTNSALAPIWTRIGRAPITARGREPVGSGNPDAQVAQLVEHVTENHGVGGSIPPLGTTLVSEASEIARADVAAPSCTRGLRR